MRLAKRITEGQTSHEFSTRTVEETGVWLTPGTAFGESGEAYVRIALTVPEERLRAAGERLRAGGRNRGRLVSLRSG